MRTMPRQINYPHRLPISDIDSMAASLRRMAEKVGRDIKYEYKKVSYYPIIIALFLLIIVPIALILNAIDAANDISIAAFFLLVIGIAWKVISYGREKPFLQKEF